MNALERWEESQRTLPQRPKLAKHRLCLHPQEDRRTTRPAYIRDIGGEWQALPRFIVCDECKWVWRA